jgi:hemerythrin-like metal-binding protein
MNAAAAEGRADELRASLRFLERYAVDRFASEERWMTAHGYPGGREHARAHAVLVDAITAARRAVEDAGADLALHAARAGDLLRQHMRTEDLRVGQYWIARENLRRLAESGPGAGVTLTPIPGMLRAVPPAAPPAAAEGERPARPAPTPAPPSTRR